MSQVCFPLHLFVMPSSTEGFGLDALEATSAGDRGVSTCKRDYHAVQQKGLWLSCPRGHVCWCPRPVITQKRLPCHLEQKALDYLPWRPHRLVSQVCFPPNVVAMPRYREGFRLVAQRQCHFCLCPTCYPAKVVPKPSSTDGYALVTQRPISAGVPGLFSCKVAA